MGAPIWPAPTKATRKGLFGRQAGGDGLDLRVLLEALDATLATDAARLVATERGVGAVEDARRSRRRCRRAAAWRSHAPARRNR